MSRSSSQAKVRKLAEQKVKRESRAKSEPEPKPARAKASTTSYLLPNTLLDELQKTRLELQVATEDRKRYSASNIVRAALQNFVRMEMDAQIDLISRYLQAEARASE